MKDKPMWIFFSISILVVIGFYSLLITYYSHESNEIYGVSISIPGRLPDHYLATKYEIHRSGEFIEFTLQSGEKMTINSSQYQIIIQPTQEKIRVENEEARREFDKKRN